MDAIASIKGNSSFPISVSYFGCLFDPLELAERQGQRTRRLRELYFTRVVKHL
jgi:hypothetical protein